MTTTIEVSLFLVFTLALSNLCYKLTSNFVYSRKLAHALVGVIILFYPRLFDTPLVPVSLAAGALVLFCLTHTREVFYGVQKRGRLSEVYFAFSVMVCLATGWWIDPWVGVAAALFLAWGDGITGLVRYPLYKTQFEKGWAGSVAMLGSCLLIALMVMPYWAGAVGAVVATALEKWGRVDDNITAPLGALAVMALLGVWI